MMRLILKTEVVVVNWLVQSMLSGPDIALQPCQVKEMQ